MEGMTLFLFHVIVVGILIAVTAFIAYNAGKNKGRFISDRQDNRTVKKNKRRNTLRMDLLQINQIYSWAIL